MTRKDFKVDVKMKYLLKIGNKKYNFYFSHFGTNYWNMNWAVFIENFDNKKDWEYHDLSTHICIGKFNPAQPYEWILQYADKRFKEKNFVVEKIY